MSYINDAILDGQPFEIRYFLRHFQPSSEREEALLMSVQRMLREGDISQPVLHEELASFADAILLKYLWDEHPSSQDYFIRKKIMDNPKCPPDLLIEGLSDRDQEVRRAAIRRLEVPLEALLECAQYETNPLVQAALKERLGNLYHIRRREPIGQPAMQAQALGMDGSVHSVTIGTRHLPLGDRISRARSRTGTSHSNPLTGPHKSPTGR